MNDKIASLHSTFSVNNEVSYEDTRFLSIVIDVMHTGENLNYSYFEKEVVDACIDSIKNTPVLGFVRYNEETNEKDFKGHERLVTKTDNGIEEKYLCSAYGVIPESCNPRWTVKMCSDGHEREFLQVDALLWTKFDDSTSIIERDVQKAQSMELSISSVEGYGDENGLFHFTDFKFDGCCLLGNGVQPAMVDANVTLKEVQFSMDAFTESIRSELNDKFELFNTTFAEFVNDRSNQGGAENMSETDMEQVVEETATDFEQVVETEEVVAETAEVEDGVTAEFEVESADTETEIADVNADYEKVKADYEEMAVAFSQLKEEFETIKAEYEDIKPKYDEYVRAEEQRVQDELNAQKDAKFAEYEDVLSEVPEFAALKEKKDEMSVSDIEKECAVMFVKVTRTKMNFSKPANTAALNIVNDESELGEVEGYVSTKYGLVKRGR